MLQALQHLVIIIIGGVNLARQAQGPLQTLVMLLGLVYGIKPLSRRHFVQVVRVGALVDSTNPVVFIMVVLEELLGGLGLTAVILGLKIAALLHINRLVR